MPIARRTTWSKAGKARGTGDAQAPVVGRGCLALPAADAAGIQHILQIDGGRGLRAMPRDPRELGHLARVYAPRRGVRGLPRRLPDRRADDLDALSAEDRVESTCELAVVVADQELQRSLTLGEREGEVPRLLGCPGTVWILGQTGEVDASG